MALHITPRKRNSDYGDNMIKRPGRRVWALSLKLFLGASGLSNTGKGQKTFRGRVDMSRLPLNCGKLSWSPVDELRGKGHSLISSTRI